MLPEPYQYKRPNRRLNKMNLNRIKHEPEGEGLRGIVLNQKASALEERFARALRKIGLEFYFQVVVQTPFQIPGQLNTVDFLIVSGIAYPIEIDGDWVHKTEGQKKRDMLRDAVIDAKMAKQGWQPIRRVRGHDLQTQDDADRVVRELF